MADSPWIITAEELRGCVKDVFLLDVREPEEHAESSIPGCTLIPLGELAERAGELDKNADIVVYCAAGVRSLQGLMILNSWASGKSVRSRAGFTPGRNSAEPFRGRAESSRHPGFGGPSRRLSVGGRR